MLVFVFIVSLFGLSSTFDCKFDGTGKDEDKLQIHLVPHTHDDAGWLKTVDESAITELRIQYDTLECSIF